MSIKKPNSKKIRSARQKIAISQTAAAELVYVTLRTWQRWEAGDADMPLGYWELFLAKTDPRLQIHKVI